MMTHAAGELERLFLIVVTKTLVRWRYRVQGRSQPRIPACTSRRAPEGFVERSNLGLPARARARRNSLPLAAGKLGRVPIAR